MRRWLEGCRRWGCIEGDSIASLEFSDCAVEMEWTCWGPAYWARLGQFRIVAEVYYFSGSSDMNWPGITEFLPDIQGNNFWEADTEQQKQVINALIKTGARAVVSVQEPRGPDAANWEKIGDTGYHMRLLEPATTGSFSN